MFPTHTLKIPNHNAEPFFYSAYIPSPFSPNDHPQPETLATITTLFRYLTTLLNIKLIPPYFYLYL